MNLYLRANCIRLEKLDPETNTMCHVRLVTFERSPTAFKTLNWCNKFSSVEKAVLALIALCEKRGTGRENTWNSREVIPVHFGEALKYKRVGYHVFT